MPEKKLHLETVETREEAQAKQDVYAHFVRKLGLAPRATIGYKTVWTATGPAFEVYLWANEGLERLGISTKHLAKVSSGVRLK